MAAGELPPTIRIHRPGNEVAFGRQDLASPGYEAAAEAARAAGFAAVERLAGGRAAVFHEGTIAIARAYGDPQPPKRTYARFEEMADLIAAALRGLGVDARVGEVPGEYCPGAYSVNARGAIEAGRHRPADDPRRRPHGRGRGRLGRPRRWRACWSPSTRRSSSTGTRRPRASVSEELGREVDPGELEEALIAELAQALRAGRRGNRRGDDAARGRGPRAGTG